MNDLIKQNYLDDEFYYDIKEILTNARNNAYRAVNFTMVQAYCEISKSIVEKQGGAERNLRIMRQIYLYFPIWHAERAKLSWSHYLQLIKIENERAKHIYKQKKSQHMLRLVFIFCNFLSSSIGFNPYSCFLRFTFVFYFRF